MSDMFPDGQQTRAENGSRFSLLLPMHGPPSHSRENVQMVPYQQIKGVLIRSHSFEKWLLRQSGEGKHKWHLVKCQFIWRVFSKAVRIAEIIGHTHRQVSLQNESSRR